MCCTDVLVNCSSYLGVAMTDKAVDTSGDADTGVAVGTRVRAYPGTDAEVHGVVIDDFAEAAGVAVDIGDHHIADAARRWAVQLDTGTLLFADDDQLAPE